MNSRPVKVAATLVAAVGLIAGLQVLKESGIAGSVTCPSIGPNPTTEVVPGGLHDMCKLMIPSIYKDPGSVPLAEISKSKGVLKVEQVKSRTSMLIADGTVVAVTPDPKNGMALWLEMRLPGTVLTKTHDGIFEEYRGLTLDVRIDATTLVVGAVPDLGIMAWNVPAPAFEVGRPISIDIDIDVATQTDPSRQADNAMGLDTLKRIDADIGRPNTADRGYRVVAYIVYLQSLSAGWGTVPPSPPG